MNKVFSPYLDKFCLVYLDDIPCTHVPKEEHLQHLKVPEEVSRQHELYAKPSKL